MCAGDAPTISQNRQPAVIAGPGLIVPKLGPALLLLAALLGPPAVGQTLPANDNFANAGAISSANITVLGNNDYATKEPGEPNHAENLGGKSVWWRWQATAQGFVSISTRGSTSSLYGGPLDTVLAVYTGSSVSSLTEVAANDEDPAAYYTSRVGFTCTPGTLYQIAVDGYTYGSAADADSGDISLSLAFSTSPANDDFANAAPLAGTNVSVTANNTAATKQAGEPSHDGNAGGKSVWWYWQAPEAGFVNLDLSGSSSSQTGQALDALLAVYTGSSISNLAWVASQTGTYSGLSFRVAAGQVYRIAVDGYSYGAAAEADSGDIRLTLRFSTSLPLAPAWGPLPDIYGNQVSSTDFAGKVIVLNFWATWCSPCVSEIPDLVALQDKYATDGLSVVGISVDNSPDGFNPPVATVTSFFFSHGMNYSVLMDRPSWTDIEYAFGGIPYIPKTFIIDRQNRIWATLAGGQTYATFERQVLPLLYTNLNVNLALSGAVAHLSWPVTQASFILESSTNLLGGTWAPVAATVQSDGLSRFVDLPVVPGRQFFRLRSQ